MGPTTTAPQTRRMQLTTSAAPLTFWGLQRVGLTSAHFFPNLPFGGSTTCVVCSPAAQCARTRSLCSQEAASTSGAPALHQFTVRDVGALCSTPLGHGESWLSFCVRRQQQMAVVLEKTGGHPGDGVVSRQRLFCAFLPKYREAKDGEHRLHSCGSIAKGPLQSSPSILPHSGQHGQRCAHCDHSKEATNTKSHQLPTGLERKRTAGRLCLCKTRGSIRFSCLRHR